MLHIVSARLYQRLFPVCNFHLRWCLLRNISIATNSKSSVVECLSNRGVLRVSGQEASVFLQGLITNDMRHLEEGAQSMYAMFLNTKGRVMYDSIVYQSKENDTFLVECDKSAISSLQKHLKMYRVRKQVAIEYVEDLKVWTIFNPLLAESDDSENDDAAKSENDAAAKSDNEAILNNLKNRTDIIATRDPRLCTLGVRLLVPSTEDITLQNDQSSGHEVNYRLFRYKLGIGEGVNDLPSGNCFPLEANGDYLHGISFHKGCYIGQELTARTHHTGVVRKRLMPLIFESKLEDELKLDTPIQHPSGCNKTALGKLRGIEQNVGLALLRIAEALDVSNLKILHLKAETKKPSWWPQEAPKERNAISKT